MIKRNNIFLAVLIANSLFGATIQRPSEMQPKSDDMPRSSRLIELWKNLCLWEWQKDAIFHEPEAALQAAIARQKTLRALEEKQ